MYFSPLTSIRGVLALIVLLYHYFFLLPDVANLVNPHITLISKGYLAVDFFFVLSGFILTLVYKERLPQLKSAKAYGQFMLTRFGRIFPLHWFVLLGLFAFQCVALFIGNKPAFEEPYQLDFLLRDIFLVQSWLIFQDGSWNAPSWSISTEWFAYWLFPFIAGFLVHKSAFSNVLLYTLMVVGLFALIPLSGHENLNIHEDYGLIRCLLEFTMGIASYKLYEVLKDKTWSQSSSLPFLLTSLGCIGVIELLHSDPLTVSFFGPIVFFLACNKKQIQRVFSHPALVFIGEISFSLYLIHMPVSIFTASLLKRLYKVESFGFKDFSLAEEFMWLFILIGISTLVSTLSYYTIETPSRKAVKSLVKKGLNLNFLKSLNIKRLAITYKGPSQPKGGSQKALN